MISLIAGKYSTVTLSIDLAKTFLVVLWTERATGRFTGSISLKYHYSRTWWIPLKLYFLTFPLTWCGCYKNQKMVMGFSGGTKTFTWVVKSPRLLLIVINVRSKVINNEDTARSFDVSFEVDVWKEIEEYALSGFNIVDDHCQYYQEPAAISTKHPSASPLAIPHKIHQRNQ